ncbi:hypothetical protein C8F04DRAFT_1060248 [Mycena alexandri]|uniref:Uncharacterized protein n=1 Tax=Mycena alexandri TaxID=1745969 RepID=A0AAD6TM51_9AGAR|nr:hypothetical protein C8F04DRAFT_1060248 [Mycena alexandri]
MTTSLSVPLAAPAEETVVAFLSRIAYLTTRTRMEGNRWVGSPEVAVWNALNPMPCVRCSTSKGCATCTVREGHPGCLECRRSKIACDRKIRFLFEATREEFFPTREQFMSVYTPRDRTRCRTLKKSANKRRKTHVLFVEGAQAVTDSVQSLRKEIEDLRAQLQTQTAV